MNDQVILVLGAAVIVLLLYIAVKLQKSGDGGSGKKTLEYLRFQEDKIDKTRQELSELLLRQNDILNSQMSESNKSMQNQFAISQRTISQTQRETSDIIRSVTEKLSIVEKTNSQVVDFAKQMDSLEKILKNPKQRGILGEYFLETTLKNVLPPGSFQMQYKFNNGEIVDAAVFVKDKIVPIDSKFSLENYNKIVVEEDPIAKIKLEKDFIADLKNRIEETAKYIRPEENTMEFAFMFIPSEGIYYDLLVNKIGAIQSNTRDLLTYAFAEKNVIIVSPTSFLAYLQTVLQGLRALKIEESALEIKENVSKLAKHLKAYDEYFDKLGKHLGTAVNTYNSANKELKKIDKDVFRISEDEIEINSDTIDVALLSDENS